MRKIGLASALTAGVVSVTAATASATTAQDSAAAVHFTATPSSNAAVITTDTGSMTADRGVFSIKAPNGAVLAKADLSFRVDDFVFPIVAEIKNRTATLTPRLDLKHAVYQPIAQPDPSQVQLNAAQREQAAWMRMSSTMVGGAALGTAVGAVGGAGLGCVLGGIAGATIASATIIGLFGAFLPAAVIGCVGGAIALSSLGTVAGQLLLTLPAAALGVAQYFTTVNAPLPGAR